VSVDGVNQNIPGDSNIAVLPLNPADNDAPADGTITINEVTAYAFAWKKGLFWTVGPNPIPIGYMTRAGALWKGGQSYRYDAAVTNGPPLSWVNVPPPFPIPDAPPTSLATNAFRSMTNRFAANVPFTVTVAVTPATNVTVYAAEEELPAGWTARNFSTSGVLDPINGKVKWGPFFDNLPRVLTYQAVSPANATGTVIFTGTVSFDGSPAAIAGLEHTRSWPPVAPQLSPSTVFSNGQFQFTLTGSTNDIYQIETSSNLVNWVPLSAATNLGGAVLFSDEVPPSARTRFYRATVVP
jgi:hypothetical protein